MSIWLTLVFLQIENVNFDVLFEISCMPRIACIIDTQQLDRTRFETLSFARLLRLLMKLRCLQNSYFTMDDATRTTDKVKKRIEQNKPARIFFNKYENIFYLNNL